jgi:hypothetical protein
MQKLNKLRDKAYGHIDTGVIAKALYDDYKKEIEENIIVLARICGNEDSTTKTFIMKKFSLSLPLLAILIKIHVHVLALYLSFLSNFLE